MKKGIESYNDNSYTAHNMKKSDLPFPDADPNLVYEPEEKETFLKLNWAAALSLLLLFIILIDMISRLGEININSKPWTVWDILLVLCVFTLVFYLGNRAKISIGEWKELIKCVLQLILIKVMEVG